jgi:hypothetical protein
VFLPGLLHTEEYRRALIWIEFPHKPPSEVDRMLQVGMKRQARLTDRQSPLSMDVFIDGSVLRRTVGNVQVMSEQLYHLADLGKLPNVSIRVVSGAVGAYRGLVVGTFVMLEFPPHPTAELTMPPIIYSQGYLGDLYLEKPEEIRQYREACADIDRLALDEEDSRALILQIAEEYAQ